MPADATSWIGRCGPPIARLVRRRLRPARLGDKLAIELTRRSPPTDVVRTSRERSGLRLQCDLRDELSWNVYYRGTADPHLAAWMRRWLGPGDTYVDVGAHIGSLVSVAVEAVGPTGTVIALEPQPETFQKLARAAAGVERPHIELHACAAGAEDGTAAIRMPTGVRGQASSRATLVAGEEFVPVAEVPIRRLDDVVAGRDVRLLKIDTEGYEPSVVAGAGRTLSACGALLVELNPRALRHGGSSDASLLRQLRDQGLEPFALGPAGALAPFRDDAPRGEYVDLVFLRRPA